MRNIMFCLIGIIIEYMYVNMLCKLREIDDRYLGKDGKVFLGIMIVLQMLFIFIMCIVSNMDIIQRFSNVK